MAEHEEILAAFNATYEHARQHRLPIEQRWDSAWRVYNNAWDFSRKADWQARAWIAKIPLQVEFATSILRRALIDAREWFVVEGLTEEARRAAPILQRLVYYYLDRERFAERLPDALKAALVGSLIVAKVHLRPALRVKAPTPTSIADELYRALLGRDESGLDAEIGITFIDPYNVWLDPTGRDLWIIEREVLDFAVLQDLAEAGLYDAAVVEQIRGDFTRREDDDKAKIRAREVPGDKPPGRREVELLHFWGSLPHPDGEGWLIKDGHFVVANQQYIVRGPLDNPYGFIPYVIGTPFRRPWSPYGKGLVEDVVGLAQAMTELLNLSLDAAMMAAVRAFEIDVDLLDDPQELLSGIYPGKVFRKRGTINPGQRLLNDIQISPIHPQVLVLYEQLDREIQSSTGVTDPLMGLPTDRGSITATQFVRSQQQGMSLLGEVARNLESTFLAPLVERLAKLVAQYHTDFLSPEVIEILGPDEARRLGLMDEAARAAWLSPVGLRIRVRGFANLVSRATEVQQITQFFQTVAALGPQLSAYILEHVDVRAVLARLIRASGWHEADILKPEAPQVSPLEAVGRVPTPTGAPGQGAAAVQPAPAPNEQPLAPEFPPGVAAAMLGGLPGAAGVPEL